jgi:carboxylesterase
MLQRKAKEFGMFASLKDAFAGEEFQPVYWQGRREIAVLLVHGFPGTPAEMHAPAIWFHELGWTVHAPLLPGFGSEIEHLSQQGHEQWRHAVEQAYRQLKQSHAQVVVAGFSMGGALTMQLAAQHSPTALILFAPFWRIESWLWGLLPVLKYIFPQIKPFQLVKLDFNDPETRKGIGVFMPDVDLDDPRIQAEIRSLVIPTRIMDELRRVGHAAGNAAQHIHCPTLVLQGTQDDLVKPALTRQLIAHFPQRVRYTEVNGTHQLLSHQHNAWQQIQPVLSSFIQSLQLEEKR